MNKKNWTRAVWILALFFVAGIIATPRSLWGDSFLGQKLQNFKVTLGLDLAGGTELDYQIDLSEAIAQNSDNDPQNDVNLNSIAESVRDALEKRVNPAGVGEIVVKRAQVNNEEHVIIQMPPSANVEKMRKDAERDNRLEFFEESPEKIAEKKSEISRLLSDISFDNWEEKIAPLIQKKEAFLFTQSEPLFKDQIIDQAFAEKLFASKGNTVLDEVLETKTEAKIQMSPEGEMKILSFPKDVLAIVKVGEKKIVERSKDVPPKAKARHILFGYSGATRSDENVPYKTKEEAKAKAEEILLKLQNEGTEKFSDLAKEFSTESAAKETGGDLGEFEPGKMVKEFDEAIFKAEKPGLLPSLVETEFGFHIIDILSLSPEKKESVQEPQLTYEMLYWEVEDIGWAGTDLSGKDLENAVVGYNEIGQPLVNLLFDAKGGDKFALITERVASKKCNEGGPCRLGIKVGGEWITQPSVREKIVGRSAQISGNFTWDSARELADGLNLGAIDAPIILKGQTSITPELGSDQLQKSMKAGIFGLLGTIVFMILIYRFAGVMASIALIIYVALFVFILKVWPNDFGGPIVLTLPGIAGAILSVGLAVDGNILIFERMKEEFYKGQSFLDSFHHGFERAWLAIRDSHVMTLISCVILFSLGSSVLKGFAITLIIGTLLSLFTATTVSRNLLEIFLQIPFFRTPSFFAISSKKLKK